MHRGELSVIEIMFCSRDAKCTRSNLARRTSVYNGNYGPIMCCSIYIRMYVYTSLKTRLFISSSWMRPCSLYRCFPCARLFGVSLSDLRASASMFRCLIELPSYMGETVIVRGVFEVHMALIASISYLLISSLYCSVLDMWVT